MTFPNKIKNVLSDIFNFRKKNQNSQKFLNDNGNLNDKSSKIDIYRIYPLIVPSIYYDQTVWDLPHEPFPNKDYILTWVFFTGENAMRYITRDQFFLLNTDYPNWQQQSFENLRNSTDNFYTNFRTDVETNALSCIIFSNNDGIGSSRILLSNELEKGFPEGYHVAMPDRAFGLVISKNISSTEEQNITNIIAEYYGCTGTAMSDYIMDKTDFSLPNSWTLTIDKKISDWIVDEIKEYKNN